MIKKKKVTRLSLKFIGVVFAAAISAVLLFGLLFFNRYRIFHLAVDQSVIDKTTTSEIDKLQKNITEKKLSKNNQKAIRKEMRKFRGLTMYLYDDEENIVKEASMSKLEDKVYVKTASFLLTLYEPKAEEYILKFKDGSYPLMVYSYQGINFMIRFIIFAAGASVLLFVAIIMLFVHRKMKYVLSIGEEMKMIENGNFHHTIVYKGNDELSDLARQLNHLRNALYDNMLREQEARKANEELVTTMSHDLRTPLTSLLGYLDILDMKIYKNEEGRDTYIKKSRQKAEQIKEMSDKLFNHFLVYAKDEEITLHPISSTALHTQITSQCEELRDMNYTIHQNMDNRDYQILGDENLLRRVFDNVFSNVKKYASKELVLVTLLVDKGKVNICVKNKKKKDHSKEESTQIGLKSVDKMMKQMNGNLSFTSLQEDFIVELVFPCRLL